MNPHRNRLLTIDLLQWPDNRRYHHNTLDMEMGLLLQPTLLRFRHCTHPGFLAKDSISRPHHSATARPGRLLVVHCSLRASCFRAAGRRRAGIRLGLCRGSGVSCAVGSRHGRARFLDLVLLKAQPTHRSSLPAEDRDTSDHVCQSHVSDKQHHLVVTG
jgi:hypothetical protein